MLAPIQVPQESTLLKNQSQLGPSILLFVTTALWGIFWLPLRHIEKAGISGVWAVVAINVVPLVFLIPFVIYRRKFFFDHLKTKCLVGLAMGGGMAFYAIAFLYTGVLRTTLLFYMSPIWATLLSMFVLGEKINVRRWIAIAVAICGLVLILSGQDSTTTTGGVNRGDVFALLSCLFWGYGTVLLKQSDDLPAADMVPSQYLWATIIGSLVLLSTVGSADFRAPALAQWIESLPLIIGFYVVIILPTIFIATRIAQILSPGRFCLLMMSEVLVAAISAPLLAGEAISAIEWLAGLLIITATVIEVFSTPPDQATGEVNKPA